MTARRSDGTRLTDPPLAAIGRYPPRGVGFEQKLVALRKFGKDLRHLTFREIVERFLDEQEPYVT